MSYSQLAAVKDEMKAASLSRISKPNFFIVGAPRCGTTALFQFLEQHPDIYGATLKEPHFFGQDLHYPRRPNLEQYLSYFREARSESSIGEASTSYLMSRLAAQEIKEFAPSARIIIMIRNPVETMYSVHSMLLYYCDEDIENFEEALGAEPDRKKGLRWPAKPHIVNYVFYREVVQYTEQIQRYFRAFGRDNVRVIIHDDFRASTPNVYRRTLGFLGVEPGFRPIFRSVNQNRVARSQRFQAILRSRRVVDFCARFLPRRMDELLLGGTRRVNTSTKPRKAIEPVLRRQLEREFTPEVEKLSELLGRDLTHWCRS